MQFDNYPLKDFLTQLKKFPAFYNFDINTVLSEVAVFKSLTADVRKRVIDQAALYEFENGQMICRHGTFDERFYVILDGCVKAVMLADNNPQYEVYRLQKGEFFGEEIVFSGDPRENSIIAVDKTFLLGIDSSILQSVIESSAKVISMMDECYIKRKLHRDMRRVPLFTHLSDSVFASILGHVELIKTDTGVTVVSEGEDGDAFYLIRNGEVKVFKKTDTGDALISILGVGQFFGEMSLVSKEQRNATVITSQPTALIKLSRANFMSVFSRDQEMHNEVMSVIEERKVHMQDALKNPDIAIIKNILLQLNRNLDIHLDILSQCTINTEHGMALLATMPGSRYPYVYPRDSACASRFLFKLANSTLKSSDIAMNLLHEIARFILACQRADGYWGQRYSIDSVDKSIYKQEDNIAHGVALLCRYLVLCHNRGVKPDNLDLLLRAIQRGAQYARDSYYRKEIHLYYSTTSIHESAIEEGYSIWVNYAYLLMVRLIRIVAEFYDRHDIFSEDLSMIDSLSKTIDKVFQHSDRYVRRLKPNGEIDLRPDITLLSPFFFNTGIEDDRFNNNEYFDHSIEFILDTLWDPELGMLQRYLPFIEDPDTHIHAGNGPWLQYTAMLAQYYFYSNQEPKGDEIMTVLNSYKSDEGFLCEHITTAERFYEFKELEWISGSDAHKEFDDHILLEHLPYDNIVEELTHMKVSYWEIEAQIQDRAKKYITFATPLMWSHAEYAMALIMKAEHQVRSFNNKYFTKI